MTDAIHTEIDCLRKDISELLRDKVHVFDQRHEDLDTHNQNLLKQIKETKNIMAEMRIANQDTKAAARRHAYLVQKNKAQEAVAVTAQTKGAFSSCMSPTPAAGLRKAG